MKKKLFQYGMAFILLLIFLQTDMGQNLIQTFTNIEGAENSEIRSVGREYYVRMLLQDWKRLLFGCGFANLNWAPALGFVQDEYVLAKQGFVVLPVDNGMYGFALYYGLLGIFWAVILYAVCIKKAWIIFKRSGNFMFLFCLIWDLLGSATLYLDCTYSILEFPIILSMIEMYSIEEERCIDGI